MRRPLDAGEGVDRQTGSAPVSDLVDVQHLACPSSIQRVAIMRAPSVLSAKATTATAILLVAFANAAQHTHALRLELIGQPSVYTAHHHQPYATSADCSQVFNPPATVFSSYYVSLPSIVSSCLPYGLEYDRPSVTRMRVAMRLQRSYEDTDDVYNLRVHVGSTRWTVGMTSSPSVNGAPGLMVHRSQPHVYSPAADIEVQLLDAVRGEVTIVLDMDAPLEDASSAIVDHVAGGGQQLFVHVEAMPVENGAAVAATALSARLVTDLFDVKQLPQWTLRANRLARVNHIIALTKQDERTDRGTFSDAKAKTHVQLFGGMDELLYMEPVSVADMRAPVRDARRWSAPALESTVNIVRTTKATRTNGAALAAANAPSRRKNMPKTHAASGSSSPLQRPSPQPMHHQPAVPTRTYDDLTPAERQSPLDKLQWSLSTLGLSFSDLLARGLKMAAVRLHPDKVRQYVNAQGLGVGGDDVDLDEAAVQELHTTRNDELKHINSLHAILTDPRDNRPVDLVHNLKAATVTSPSAASTAADVKHIPRTAELSELLAVSQFRLAFLAGDQ